MAVRESFEHTVRPRFRAVMAHLARSLLTACVIPAVLFYVCLVTVNVWAALGAALAWCYGATGWRMITKRRASGLLILSAILMTARTAIAFSSGDTFIYFLQPVVTDALVAGVFLVSLATARPVVARLAADFYPMSHDIASRPRMRRLFWHLTLLWGMVCLAKGGATLWLLTSQSLVTFVVVKSIVLLSMTVLAVTATVSAAAWVARKEGLLAPA
jgi:Protein of unknown function (DUF3159)